MKYPDHSLRGFTLIELSIILVIIGLLIGGILGGKSLIRASELRSVSTEYGKFVTATNAFNDKYFALPGDMPNATSYWGTAAAPGACASTVGTGTTTCNGDGDGQLAYITGSNERMRYWQHLVNAGLIDGKYDGSVFSQTPPSKVGPQMLWAATSLGTVAGGNIGGAIAFDGVYNNTFTLMGKIPTEDLWTIDKKMDDGMPGTGKVRVATTRFPDKLDKCTTTSDPASFTSYDATYLVSSTTAYCGFLFPNVF